MIIGTVRADLNAVIDLTITGPGGQRIDTKGVIDTGFNGHLTLTEEEINTLNLPSAGRRQIMLGDGSEHLADVYDASVEWDGQVRNVLVESAEVQPLLGMALMEGYDLHIEIVEGGVVTLEQL